MGFLLKQIFSLLTLLHSDTGDKSIAFGVLLGYLLSFTPLLTPQGIIILLITLFFRVQLGAFLISWLGFTLVTLSLSGTLNSIGNNALSQKSLFPIYTKFYNASILPFTQFNNSIVMGGLIVSALTAPLIYWLTLILVKNYRKSVVKWVAKSKFARFIKASKFYKWYLTYGKIRKFA